MRSATFVSLGASAMLFGCGQSATTVAADVAIPPLVARSKPLKCDKYAGADHHTEKCAIEFFVELPANQDWSRLGCYGELEFSQVYEGRVSTPEQGFYAGLEKQSHMNGGEFRLIAFVYFPQAYGALEPSLKWYECKVWYADSAGAT